MPTNGITIKCRAYSGSQEWQKSQWSYVQYVPSGI